MRACAALASAIANSESITGSRLPSSTAGQKRSTNARVIATFSGNVQPWTVVISLVILVVETGIIAAIGVALSGILARSLFSVAVTYLVVAALTVGTVIGFGLIGIGSLAFGLVLMFLWYLFPRSKRFFRGESLNRDTEVMVPDEPAAAIRSIDGGV